MNDLLKPRFEVVADYPLCQFEVGDILMQKGIRKGFFSTTEQSQGIMLADILKYPHLFRKLEWWENRTEEEMPKYLKVHSDGSIAKIIKWNMDNMCGIEDSKASWCDLRLWKGSPEQYQPSNEKEYNDYVKA